MLFFEAQPTAGSLCETVLSKFRKADLRGVPSGKALKHLQTISDRYEVKLREHLQRLKICLMRDLLAFLEHDALSIDAIKEKILANGYDKNVFDYKARRDVYFCIHNLTHWSFDEIMRARNGDKEADPQSVSYISDETLKIFTEAGDLFPTIRTRLQCRR